MDTRELNKKTLDRQVKAHSPNFTKDRKAKVKDAYNDFIVRARLDTEKAEKEYYKSIKGVDKDERLALSAKYYKESETAKKNLREIMNKLSQQANDAIDYIKKIDNDVLNSIMK